MESVVRCAGVCREWGIRGGGAGVLALESMKMEFLVRAQVAGVVSGLSVLPGDHVREGLTLFEVTPRAGVVADAKKVKM